MAKAPTDLDLIAAVERYGSQRAAARALGLAKSTFQDRLLRALAGAYTSRRMPAPVRIDPMAQTRYVIATSAQDGSTVHTGFLANLKAYAEYLNDAKLLIAGYTYNKRLFEDHCKYRASYAREVLPYLTNQRYELADDLLFCGEMNTLPTATQPLAGFETYTRSRWGIFPHAKIQLASIPTMKSDPAKLIMTTGSVTLPNYVQKRAGIRAEFHHVIGAVIIELRSDGKFFCRHLIAEKDGSFYDLDRRVEGARVTTGHRIKAITFGDIHHEKLDPRIFHACFEAHDDSILDHLRPQHQFIHDLSDFTPRNHHNIKDHHFRFQAWNNGQDSVKNALWAAADFLSYIQRPWCETVVVESNHDLAYLKWLKTADYREDPTNAVFFLESQLRQYQALERNEKRFSIFEWALRESGCDFGTTRFLREDDSFTLGDIEYGMHSHLGANGAPGAIKQFTRMGPKAVIAHAHSAGIMDGIVQVGVTGGTFEELDMVYNKGLSSWSRSHCITYENDKRTIITMQGEDWRAS